MDLTWHGVELQGHVHASDPADFEREKVEKDRTITLRGQGDHLAFLAPFEMIVDPLQVGGFAAEPRTVVNDLGIELTKCVIKENHVNLSSFVP